MEDTIYDDKLMVGPEPESAWDDSFVKEGRQRKQNQLCSLCFLWFGRFIGFINLHAQESLWPFVLEKVLVRSSG